MATSSMLAIAVAPAVHAQALTKEQCVAANEHGAELRRQSRLRDARVEFRRCEARACPGPVRDDCTQQLEEIEGLMSTLTLQVTSSDGRSVQGAIVEVDGSAVDDWRDGHRTIQLDPGDHVIVVTAPRFKSSSLPFRAAARERDTQTLVLEPLPADDPAPQATTDTRRLLAFGVAGLGAVALGIGAYFGVHSKNVYDDAVANECAGDVHRCSSKGVSAVDDAHGEATVSTVSFVAAVALIAGGAMLYWLSPAPAPATARAVPTKWRELRSTCRIEPRSPQ